MDDVKHHLLSDGVAMVNQHARPEGEDFAAFMDGLHSSSLIFFINHDAL